MSSTIADQLLKLAHDSFPNADFTNCKTEDVSINGAWVVKECGFILLSHILYYPKGPQKYDNIVSPHIFDENVIRINYTDYGAIYPLFSSNYLSPMLFNEKLSLRKYDCNSILSDYLYIKPKLYYVDVDTVISTTFPTNIPYIYGINIPDTVVYVNETIKFSRVNPDCVEHDGMLAYVIDVERKEFQTDIQITYPNEYVKITSYQPPEIYRLNNILYYKSSNDYKHLIKIEGNIKYPPLIMDFSSQYKYKVIYYRLSKDEITICTNNVIRDLTKKYVKLSDDEQQYFMEILHNGDY
jgi:hypothetical protein